MGLRPEIDGVSHNACIILEHQQGTLNDEIGLSSLYIERGRGDDMETPGWPKEVDHATNLPQMGEPFGTGERDSGMTGSEQGQKFPYERGGLRPPGVGSSNPQDGIRVSGVQYMLKNSALRSGPGNGTRDGSQCSVSNRLIENKEAKLGVSTKAAVVLTQQMARFPLR